MWKPFFLAPDMFDNYIAFDPSLWWNNKYLIKSAKEHLDKFPKDEKRIWFAGSSAEDISETVSKTADILQVENLPNIKWKYSPEPKEKHKTIFRATKEKAIIWTLNKTEEHADRITRVAVAQPLFSGSIGKNARNMTSSEAILGRF